MSLQTGLLICLWTIIGKYSLELGQLNFKIMTTYVHVLYLLRSPVTKLNVKIFIQILVISSHFCWDCGLTALLSD